MTPFFFGDADRPLYGVHHEPTTRNVQKVGVLICNSLGRDYMRTHRSLVRFSGQLAKQGYHVLRFDYSATGDSFGEDGEGRLEQWSEDIGLAAQELKDLAGIDTISIVGVRVGASLAAVATTNFPIETLIMWDPIISGADYIDSQIAFSHAYYSDLNRFPTARIKEIEAGAEDIVGTPWPQEMRSSIANLDLFDIKSLRVKRLALILSEDHDVYHKLEAHFASLGCPVECRIVEERQGWEDLSMLGEAIMMHGTASHFKELLEAK